MIGKQDVQKVESWGAYLKVPIWHECIVTVATSIGLKGKVYGI